MTTAPAIILSSKDFDRLEALLDSMHGIPLPHKSALLNELARADIMEPQDIPPSIVTMNSTVEFSIDGAAQDFRLTLVYPDETEDNPACISVLAPVGSALLGLAMGDTIEWPRPGGGLIQVRIKNILYQPERAGDFRA